MDFFVYSQDAGDTSRLRGDLIDQHWSYMDRFAESMIARGPTLADDRDTATGSLHVLGLPSVADATEFVEHEPNNRAGIYAKHSIWRFADLLGRTMWEYEGDAGEPRFLVIAELPRGATAGGHVRPVPLRDLPSELRDRVIVYGGLADPSEPDVCVGVAFALEAPTRRAVLRLLDDPRSGLAGIPDRRVYNWEFGGRR